MTKAAALRMPFFEAEWATNEISVFTVFHFGGAVNAASEGKFVSHP